MGGYVAFSTSMHLFEQYLEIRQLRRNRDTKIPPEVATLGVDETQFLESQAYQADRRVFSMQSAWINFFWNKIGLAISPFLWRVASNICGAGNEYKITLLWLFMLHWSDKPLQIPLSLYSNFVVEAKHGFNKMTLGLFASDFVKSELLMYLFAGPLILAVVWLVKAGGEQFYIYVWAFSQIVLFVFMWIYPNFIQPRFNKYEPLQDDELRTKIEELASSEEFPLTRLYQVDGSKRSGHSNAYCYGFGKNKRIVVFDTLLTQPHDEILAVLLHELGHWKFMHVLTSLAINSMHMFLLLWTFSIVVFSEDASTAILQSFGFSDKAVILNLILYTTLIEPMELVVVLGMTIKSRANEFQADSFAAIRGRGEQLREGLLHINKENKGDLNPDSLYSWYHHSHPPMVERLRALEEFGKKKE